MTSNSGNMSKCQNLACLTPIAWIWKMKQTESNIVRGSECRRFRAVATFCHGFADGVGGPMFELRHYAWKRGRRRDATGAGLENRETAHQAGAGLDRS